MKLQIQRLIAVDGAKTGLDELANALRHGAACIQFHFQDQNLENSDCPAVPMIIASPHLMSGLGENSS